MNLPASFIAYTRSLLGEEEYEKLAVALGQKPPVSVRLNQTKWSVQLAHRVPWSAQGFYLGERPTFASRPSFSCGVLLCAGSFVHVCGASNSSVRIWCGNHARSSVRAPGGKSNDARSVLPEGSLLVANEVMRNRSQILAENLTKVGTSGCRGDQQ